MYRKQCTAAASHPNHQTRTSRPPKHDYMMYDISTRLMLALMCGQNECVPARSAAVSAKARPVRSEDAQGLPPGVHARPQISRLTRPVPGAAPAPAASVFGRLAKAPGALTDAACSILR